MRKHLDTRNAISSPGNVALASGPLQPGSEAFFMPHGNLIMRQFTIGDQIQTDFCRGVIVDYQTPRPNWDAKEYFWIRTNCRVNGNQVLHLIAGHEIIDMRGG